MARIGRRVFVVLALALAGCAPTPRLGEVAARLPLAAKNARLFIYRDYDLSQSLQWVPVEVNGAEIGDIGLGHVVVCDLPPGIYTIAPRAEYLWPDQAKTVRVEAGQAIYAKVGNLWTTGSGTGPVKLAALRVPADQMADASPSLGVVPVFVVMLQDPAIGEGEVGALWYAPCTPPYAPG